MEIKEHLTNEKLRSKFESQFDLVNYAIKLAVNMITTGRDPRIKVDSQNRSLQVIGEIMAGKDQFDVILEEAPVAVPVVEKVIKFEELDDDEEEEAVKPKEKKKSKKKASALR